MITGKGDVCPLCPQVPALAGSASLGKSPNLTDPRIPHPQHQGDKRKSDSNTGHRGHWANATTLLSAQSRAQDISENTFYWIFLPSYGGALTQAKQQR